MEFRKLMVTFFFIMGSSMATVYQVGDSIGWTININYKNWTSNRIFQIGDTLVFKYNARDHNVLQVNMNDYNSCTAKSTMAIYNTGNDSINLSSAGDYYYISGFPAQCEAGQRVHIKIVSASTALLPNTSLVLGKVPKPPIPFPPHVVVYPYPSASSSLSSKCLIVHMLGVTFIANFYFF